MNIDYNDLLDYTKLTTADFEVISSHNDNGLIRTDLAVTTPFGFKRIGEIIRPENETDLAAAMFIHWYEPAEPETSNRFQFVEEAKELARKGAVCLCVETLWSDLDFFYKRSQNDDLQNSFKEIVILRRFLDLLFMQEGIDKSRTLLVGHDFGGMYGLLLGSIDDRIKNFVIMSATARFSDWYLYYPSLNDNEKLSFRDEVNFIDPVTVVKKIQDSPILFQFGGSDHHVPREKALELYSAASDPKEILWYDAGHGLNDKAKTDRQSWIGDKL